jgi:hypothetical protein
MSGIAMSEFLLAFVKNLGESLESGVWTAHGKSASWPVEKYEYITLAVHPPFQSSSASASLSIPTFVSILSFFGASTVTL